MVSETPQPRNGRDEAKIKERRFELTRRSIEAVARKEAEASNTQRSHDRSKSRRDSLKRRGSQKRKGVVVF